MNYAECLEQLKKANEIKDYDSAIKYSSEMIRLLPKSGEGYFNRGLAYQNKMDNVRSISDYTDAIQLGIERKTDLALVFYNRAVAYQKQGLHYKAIKDYEMSYSLDPSDSQTREVIEKAKMYYGINSNEKKEYKIEQLLNDEIKKIKEERERQERKIWLASPEGQRWQEEERKKQEQKEKEKAEREAKEKTEREAREKAEREAAEKLLKVAEQGDAEAQCKLANAYYEGQGVPKDFAKVAEWYGKAAEQGYAEAQYQLGILYKVGLGIPKNSKKANELFRKAASQNHDKTIGYLAVRKSRKITACIIIAVVLALITLIVYKSTGSFFKFQQNDQGTLTITGYSGNKKVVIPVADKKDIPITEIGDKAFYKKKLTSVVISDGITKIGDEAFSVNQLTSLTIGNSVTSIGKGAFAGNKLTDVVIPDSVITIEDRAFADNKLNNVVIPDSVKSIGYNVFSSW
jgi:TPR repeat protein